MKLPDPPKREGMEQQQQQELLYRLIKQLQIIGVARNELQRDRYKKTEDADPRDRPKGQRRRPTQGAIT